MKKPSWKLASWCGFTVDTKNQRMFYNFLKYRSFQKKSRFVKHDNQPFHSLFLSLKRVLDARLGPIAKEKPKTTADLQNRQIMVYGSILFSIKRTIRHRRFMNKRKLKNLVLWISRYVSSRSCIPLDQVHWIVRYCFLVSLRNSSVYSHVIIEYTI